MDATPSSQNQITDVISLINQISEAINKAETPLFQIPEPTKDSFPPAPPSSPISAIECTFSSPPNPSSRRLSTSTSISTSSIYHDTPEATNHEKKKPLKIRTSCLQCTTLGLRCTIPREPLRQGQDRSVNFCLRCQERGERFCILQDRNSQEYWADGASEREVEERVDELLTPRKECWKFCLPKIPPGTRASLTRWWQDGLGNGLVAEGSDHENKDSTGPAD